MRARRSTDRPGTILPLLALTITLLFAFIALAVDVGVLTIARTEAQSGCDAAALAGARVLNNRPSALNNDSSAAATLAQGIATSNINVYIQSNTKYTTADNMTFSDGTVPVQVGQYTYDATAQRFNVAFPATLPTGSSWTAVRVTMQGNQPTFFANVFGVNSMPWRTYATAAHRPRDIAIILDFTGSMAFGSQFTWNGGWAGGTVYGTMSPDPIYPQYGHYWRYTQYGTTVALNSTNAAAATPAGRPHPLSNNQQFDLGVNGTQGLANLTVETASGPPIILDFRFDPSNVSTPATPVTTPNPSNYWNAFNRWMQASPAVENMLNDGSYRPAVLSSSTDANGTVTRTFNWAGYSAFDLTNQFGPTPAPDFFKDQADDATSGVNYVGDRSPRKGGQIFTTATTWDTTTITGAAKNVQLLLSKATAADSTLIATGTRLTAPGTLPSGYTFPPLGDGGSSWANFRDDVWETYGYDLDVAKYSGTSPAGVNRATAQLRTTNLFNGFSMGPAYYGKTFFMWPPDPRFNPAADVTAPNPTNLDYDTSGRAMSDWRRRFFYKPGFTETNTAGRFNPQTDNINGTLLSSANGGPTLNSTTTGYKVNYRAVLAWLKTGPQTLPPNLRAGRLVYYTSIPDDVDDLTNLDKRFWRDYIDYVLGYTGNWSIYNPANQLAGNETKAWPEGKTVSLTAPTAQGSNPKPYMSYTDVPNMPRIHFWFGPLTMLGFIGDRNGTYGWLAGTTHQAQCWQLKAAMNSALDDIKNNHPNDYCSLVHFSRAPYDTPRIPMGQDWTGLKLSLFYPNYRPGYSQGDFINLIKSGDTTTEIRPYDINLSATLAGNLPAANNGTDPVSGFAMAFNTLTWSPSAYLARSPTGSINGGTGRRGAGKIVIFETDGVPNSQPAWSYTGSGWNTYFAEGGGGIGASPADAAVQVTKLMVQQQGSGGFSTPTSPCRVYALAFGDLFTPPITNTAALNGLTFLLNVQQAGNTSSATDTALPPGNIITGPYSTRISTLRTTLQTIMQSGIQVTLIE